MTSLKRQTLIILSFFTLGFSLDGKFRAVPAIASSAETGTQLGGLVMYFFQPEPEDKYISNLGFSVLASFKNQWQIDLFPDLYLSNVDHLKLNFNFTYWPTYYFGIGNNTEDEYLDLTSKGFNFVGLYERHFFDTWWIGTQIEAGGESIEWEYQDYAEQFLDLRGLKGSKQIGMGLVSSVDFRDHHNAPRKGTKLSIEQMMYPKELGSSSTFFYGNSQWVVFWSPLGDHVLAGSAFAEWVNGDVPFRKLVSPDGAKTLRGVVSGRYRDRRHLAFNTEYRTPYFNQFGLVFFCDWAQVAPKWSELKSNGFHYAPGAGIRYAFNPEDRYNLRLDVSFLDGKEMQMTIYVKEAF